MNRLRQNIISANFTEVRTIPLYTLVVLFLHRTFHFRRQKIKSSRKTCNLQKDYDMNVLGRNAMRMCTSQRAIVRSAIRMDTVRRMSYENKKDELKKRLTPLQWHVTQEKGTERPYTGCYNKFYEKGTYTCVVCEQELFSSETKYDSGCGWPAFNEVLDQGRVKLTKDTSNDMVRTEVTCSRCGSHLGHVFNDGPKPTRKRFCINSASISFHEAGQQKNVTS